VVKASPIPVARASVSSPHKCTEKSCKTRKPFKNIRGLETHRRQVHGIYKRGPRNGKGREAIVQESINYCCFCGRQLPNATVLK